MRLRDALSMGLARIHDPLYTAGEGVGCDAQVSDEGKPTFVYKCHIGRTHIYLKGDTSQSQRFFKLLRKT